MHNSYLLSYLFMRDPEREAETQAEGETGSLRGPRRGTRFRDPGVTPWAEGRCSTAEPPWCLRGDIFKNMIMISGPSMSWTGVGSFYTRAAVGRRRTCCCLSFTTGALRRQALGPIQVLRGL